MNETTLNQDCMYQNVTQIQELNKVEGFDPRRYMRQLQGEGQIAKYYLDVVYRKLWFRLRYPNGKIVKTLKKLTEQVAIVEARVYLDKNDPEDCFISNALAQKYMTADNQFGNKYVELAETAAVGRALADAGFGLQFADLEGEADPNIVDSGIEQMQTVGENGEEAGETLLEEAEQLPGQYDINEYLEETSIQQSVNTGTPAASEGNVPPAMAGASTAGAVHPVSAAQNTAQQNTARQNTASQNTAGQTQNRTAGNGTAGNSTGQAPARPSVQDMLAGIQRNLPEEQIYNMLNRDMAVALVISAGCYKDKLTLGQLAVEKPQALKWYVNDYKGPDNLLRAAARFLLDGAGKAA